MTTMLTWASAPPMQASHTGDAGNLATANSPFNHANVDNALYCLCGADTMLTEAIHIGRDARAQSLTTELAFKAVQLTRAVANTIGCAADLLLLSYNTDNQHCAVLGGFASTLTAVAHDVIGETAYQ